MNKLRTAVAALVIATGAFGAYAFTNANNSTTEATATDPHWFDAENGEYLGQRSQALQQANCGQEGVIDCAYGYSGRDANGEPEGSLVGTASKQP